jgi:Cdc6-like AAA superfamily ATPase
MYLFRCIDKDGNERWDSGRDPMNFPAPFRACIIGKPGSGKSSICKNILLAANPPYDQVYIAYPNACRDRETEWDCVEPNVMFNDVPSADELYEHVYDHSQNGAHQKKILIIDDVDINKGSSRERQERLNQLLKNESSHGNLSLCFNTHSFFDTPNLVRKMCNVFIVFPTTSRRELREIGERIGAANLSKLFELCCTSDRDSLCFDLTIDSPYKLRKNMTKILDPELIKLK